MTAEDRNAWVQVARATLTGIPGDLLAIGCKLARQKCRFASEIVPTIIETVGSIWEGRKRALERERQAYRNAPRLEKPDYVTPDQAREILREIAEETARNLAA